MDSSSNLRRKDTTKGPPLRILCLDGGGVRGYSMLIILKRLMHCAFAETEGRPPSRNEIPKPCEYFDLIAGTGTGGLIAIMLGRLRLDIETSMEVYVRMTKMVFETDKTFAGLPYKNTLFKASKLEEAIRTCVRDHTAWEDEGNDGTASGGREVQDITSPAGVVAPPPVGRSMSLRSNNSDVLSLSSPRSQRPSSFAGGNMGWGNPDASLYDGRENRTKTAVTAVYKGTNPKTGSSVLLRSYDSRKEPAPEFDCTIWQAGRATSATGLAFKPIKIGQSVFTDEGAGKYNPSPQILEEAIVNEWPGRELGIFVSIGTGKRPGGSNMKSSEWWEGFVGGTLGNFAEARRRLIAKIEGCEDTHMQMLNVILPRYRIPRENYCRLNVEVGVGEFGMNEWDRLSEMTVNTERYLRQPDIEKVVFDAATKIAKIELTKRRIARHNEQRISQQVDSDKDLPHTPPSVPYPTAIELPGEIPPSLPSPLHQQPNQHQRQQPHSSRPPPQQGSRPPYPDNDYNTTYDKYVVIPGTTSNASAASNSTATTTLPYRPAADRYPSQSPNASNPQSARSSTDFDPQRPPSPNQGPPRPPKTPINGMVSPQQQHFQQQSYQQQQQQQQQYSPQQQPQMSAQYHIPPSSSRPLSGGAAPLGPSRLPYPDTDGPPPFVSKRKKPEFVAH